MGRRFDPAGGGAVFAGLPGPGADRDNPRPMTRFRWPYAVLTALYCAGIFALSAQPSLPDQAPTWLDFPGADKAAHAVVYAGLAALIYVGLIQSNSADPVPLVRAVPIVFATIYGLSDEIHQLFVPNRSFDLLDLLADAGGATISVLALEFWRSHRAKGGNSRRRRAINSLPKGD